MNDIGQTEFAAALAAFGWENCSLQEDRLMVGLGPDAEYQRGPVSAVPAPLSAVHFLQAPLQSGLVAALARSPEQEEVEQLFLGTSHDYAKQRRGDYDMRDAVAALARGAFPRLTALCLGDMHMLFNGHRYFGRLGDIGPALARMPTLQSLTLHGQCELSAPLQLSHLQELFLEADDIGVSGGPISQSTVDALLTSDLPALEKLELSLDEGDLDWLYDISEETLAGLKMPRLKGIWIDCLTPEAETRLDNFKARLSEAGRPTPPDQ